MDTLNFGMGYKDHNNKVFDMPGHSTNQLNQPTNATHNIFFYASQKIAELYSTYPLPNLWLSQPHRTP